MGYLILAIVIIGLIALRLLQRHLDASRPQQPAGPLPYRRKDYLLTKAERSFYEVLRLSLANDPDLIIFAKVRLLDLLWLPKGTAKAQSHRNKVQSKHVDFVICERR